MNLNRLLAELTEILEGAAIPSNEVNTSGEIKQSKYKLAIESGGEESESTCNVNLLVGISCDTNEDLLYEIGKVVYLLKGRQTSDTGNRNRIMLDGASGFQIFTPESGRWIANLKFTAPIIYDFTQYRGNISDVSIYSKQTQTETITYTYQ